MEKILNKEFVSILRSLDDNGNVYLDMMKEIAIKGYCFVKIKVIERDIIKHETKWQGLFFPTCEITFSPNKRYDGQEYDYYSFTMITTGEYSKIFPDFHKVEFHNTNDTYRYMIISCEPLGDEIINCLKRSIVKKYRNY